MQCTVPSSMVAIRFICKSIITPLPGQKLAVGLPLTSSGVRLTVVKRDIVAFQF